MKHIARYSILMLFLVWGGCGGSGDGTNPAGSGSTPQIKERSPENARRELGELGVQFDAASFAIAVENGDLLAISLFLDAGMDPHTTFVGIWPVLIWAVGNDKRETVRLLLEKGVTTNTALLNRGGEYTDTALARAAREGYLEMVKLLLDARTNIKGTGALAEAARGGHHDVVEFLLSAGADPVETESMGQSMLQYAVGRDDTELVQKLLEQKVDPDVSSVLKVQIEKSEPNLAIIRALLDAGASPDGRDSTLLRLSIQKDHVDIAQLLLEAGARPTGSVLFSAVSKGYTEMVRLMVQAYADVNERTARNVTPLMLAALGGHIEIVQILLEAGADPNMLGSDGTALGFAAEGGYIEIVQALLGAGADPSSSGGGGSALWHAANNGQTEIVRLLVDAGASAYGWGAFPLGSSGAVESRTALMAAAKLGHVEIVRILLAAGISQRGTQYVNVDASETKTKALILAAAAGYAEIVRLLLDAGAEVSATDRSNITALKAATAAGHTDVVQILKDAGATE